MAHSLLLRWIMLQLYIAHGVSDTIVRAKVGQSVKLPCTYSVRETHDLNVMCWGRGICPSSKCSSEIVRTDGQKVISKQSGRYQLKGPITKGDVSLTISNVDHKDRGAYCCRIEIPGWFNDIKRNLNLQVYRAPAMKTTTALTTPTTPAMTTTTALPTTFPSLTTIFQTASVWTEDEDFIFFTTERVLPTAESPTTGLISKRTENVDPAFITEDAVLSTVTAVATVQTSTVRTDDGHTSTDNPFATGTVPPVTVQTAPEASEVNAISDATFPLTSVGDSVKEGLGEVKISSQEETSTDSKLQSEISIDSKLQSEESVDNPTQHLQNETPTVIISVVVTVILLFTFLLVVLLTHKRSGKYQLHMIKSSDLSGEQIPNGVEEENTLLTLQQIPDGHSVSQGTCHDPVESSI